MLRKVIRKTTTAAFPCLQPTTVGFGNHLRQCPTHPMEIIRAIKNKAELEGTAYVELLPGKYRKQCWNDGSFFFEEEIFGYLEPIISRHVPEYDHYAFTEISAAQWTAIVNDFQALQVALEQAVSFQQVSAAVGFLFIGTEARFAENFRENRIALARLLAEVSIWVNKEASEHGCVTVLGL